MLFAINALVATFDEHYAHTTVNFVDPFFKAKIVPLDNAFAKNDSVQQNISVVNARMHNISLGRNGFELVSTKPMTTDEYADDEIVKSQLYGECQALVRARTNCSQTYVLGHMRRNGKPGKNFDGLYGTAVHSDIHVDFEVAVIPNFPKIQGKHFAVYNMWRSTDSEGNIESMPLAFVDTGSVAADDMVPAEAQSANNFKTIYYRLAHNSSQRWFVYPVMTPAETLLFRQYDTREPQLHQRQTFHTAVNITHPNPTGTPARRRQSIEVRVIAVFDDDAEWDDRQKRFFAETVGVPSERWQSAPGHAYGPAVSDNLQ